MATNSLSVLCVVSSELIIDIWITTNMQVSLEGLSKSGMGSLRLSK